jgi:hypothetical protein
MKVGDVYEVEGFQSQGLGCRQVGNLSTSTCD